jgi:hypothetical protein
MLVQEKKQDNNSQLIPFFYNSQQQFQFRPQGNQNQMNRQTILRFNSHMSANFISPGPIALVMIQKLAKKTRDHHVLLSIGTKTVTIVVPKFPEIVLLLGILKIMTFK